MWHAGRSKGAGWCRICCAFRGAGCEMAFATQIGRMLLIVGGMMMLLGLAFLALGRLGWQGRLLTGDVVTRRPACGPKPYGGRRPGFVFVFPIMTSLLLSAALTALLWIAMRWRR